MMMNAVSNGIDDVISRTLLRDAYVGSTRVTPVEITMLLNRLEGWNETAPRRNASTR